MTIKKVLLSFIFLLAFTISNARSEFAVVPIKNVIDGGLAAFVERAINEAQQEEKEGIIFQIDTILFQFYKIVFQDLVPEGESWAILIEKNLSK